MRLKLLDRLRDGDATVGQLKEALGASQQNLSKHLGILRSAGMIDRTKAGNQVRYMITDPSVFELLEQICSGARRQLEQLEAILG
jgi:DNA-binding transcriptional ArsR family regulator